MKNLLLILISILLFTISNNEIYAQKKKKYIIDLEKKADINFLYGEYRIALYKYLKLWKTDTLNIEYNYKLGICYSETNIATEKALKRLLFVKENDESNKDVTFYIAKSHMNLYRFTEAIELFNIYKETVGADKNLVNKAYHLIKMSYSALELMNKPVNVSFENLGANVNSRLDDYNPFVVNNEGFITFTSNKKYDPDYGTYISNVYISRNNKNKWEFAVSQHKINTTDNEEAVWMSDDGKVLFLCNSMDDEYSDILRTEKKGKFFKYYDKEEKFFNMVNSKSTENGASMTADKSIIYVSSARDGGYGDKDIYVIKKLPNGKWSEAKNIGDIINTKNDDAYPLISDDGNILYFASKGHNSIGGYDLFVSYWDVTRQEWTKPINLGYPLNTTQDNLTISFSENNRYAYMAANRKEGFGGLDIYRVTFNDIDEELSLIKGYIYLDDTITAKKFTGDNFDLEISIFDDFGNLFGMYIPKKNTGDFVAILPKGKYEIEIVYNENYKEYIESFEILDKASYKKEFDKNFHLIQK